jgi:S1-C subfamily serine protease
MDTPHDGTPAPQDHPRQTPDPGSPWGPAPTTVQATTPYGAPVPPEPGVPVQRRKGRAGLAAALVAGLAVGGGVVAVHSSATATASPSFTQSPATGSSGSLPAGWSPFGRGRFVPDQGSASAGRGGAQLVTAATSAQEAGVVDIDVVLGGTERAAGTGMVLTSDGEVLTNRHVVLGETSISVTVPATGRSYAAKVVGISTTTDVAVVQLVDASGLATVKTSSSAVSTGDAVTGVGNAGGTGGTPSAAPGTVTAVDRSITASDSDGSNPEHLTGLIETDAAIQAGDSGGPLLDSSDAVVGMDSAASAQGNDGYAIPIATALAVAHQIETHGSGTQAGAGTTASTAQRGYLGVQVEDGAGGAQVDGVVQGSPAEAAGIEAGDTITSVAGQAVDSAGALGAVTAQLSPGRTVTVTWSDQSGATHGARITLAGSAG